MGANPFEGKYVWDYLKPENSDRRDYLERLVKPYLDESEIVLDLNCGFSPLASLFLNHNNKFIGVDKSEEAINYCKEKYKSGKFYVSDDSHLPQMEHIDVFLHLGIAPGTDPWGLESRNEVQAGINIIMKNFPRLVILETWAQDNRKYAEFRDFIKKMPGYSLKNEITYEFGIKHPSINPHASEAAKRVACVFTRERDFCSLSDDVLSKFFTIFQPGCQAESVADLNLGFGYIYYALSRVLHPKLVVVLGSMMGFSPVCFALGVKDNTNEGRVVLVDAGYSDQRDGKAKGMGGIAFWEDPTKFNALFKEFNVEGIIDVVVMKTSEFAECYEEKKMPPIDLLMIDADHSFEGFKYDLEKFSGFVRDGGIILCHDVLVDYGLWDYPYGVKKYFEDVIKISGNYEYMTLNVWPGLGIVKKLSHENERDQEILKLREEIDSMKRSIVWQTTMKFHNGFIERTLPHGTWRRKMYNQCLERSRDLMKKL